MWGTYMSQEQNTIIDYLRDLNSRKPVPGGGGVSAFTGALAAGLAAMVCSLTVGKKKYADVESVIIATADKITGIQKDLVECMNADAEAFEPLSRAYGLPKNTPEEIEEKERVMEACLRDAANPPLRICELIAGLLPSVKYVADNGSRLAVSDAGCSAALAIAAIKAAALNVYINTRLMKDREYAQGINNRVDMYLKVVPEYDMIYNSVMEVLK